MTKGIVMRGLEEQSTENLSFEYQILLSVGLKCGSAKTEALDGSCRQLGFTTDTMNSSHGSIKISIMIHLSAVDPYVENVGASPIISQYAT